MNGEELREALRTEMAGTTRPPSLSVDAALRAARRTRVRRRTAWAGVGLAVALLAVTGVGAIGAPGSGGFTPAASDPGPVPPPSVHDTKQAWPTGPDGRPQEDRTARAGTRYDQGVRLLDELVAVVPTRYTVPADPANPPAGQPLVRDHQAQFDGELDGVEVWSYTSSVTVQQGQRMGRLLVEVHSAGNRLSTGPCPLTRQFWGMAGECEVVTVGTTQVGVVVRPGGDDRFDQWAAYRHPDGVVVFVAQSARLGDGQPELTALPFSPRQLATLAGDERFHLR
ncbi:hypothetical protein [Micromonospora sp. NBC_00421]|uniref:hypothetical protein n=1 Tax=Micromonospora sp. NBC_00421 TaxID=2975976 RepID=UPI002E1BEF34